MICIVKRAHNLNESLGGYTGRDLSLLTALISQPDVRIGKFRDSRKVSALQVRWGDDKL